jgi:hypothetical protein
MQVRCERKRLEHLKALKMQCEADNWPDSSTADKFKAEVQTRLERLTHAMRMLYVHADVCNTYAGPNAPRAPDACYAYAVCTC